MTRITMALALVCALLGCGTSERAPRPAPRRETPASTAPAPTVATAPAQAAPTLPSPCDVLVGEGASVAPRKLAYRESCVSDSWPEATLGCFRDASTPDAERACEGSLDEARQDWLRYRVGKAESRAAGWSCVELDAVLDEAEGCQRTGETDVDPFPEMRRSMDAALASARATPHEPTQRSTELRCISLKRLAVGHIATLPCRGPRTP